MSLGHVYFVECYGRIKIGFSQDVEQRIRDLSTGSAHDLNLVCVIPGSRHLELALHRYLKAHRVRGEWFVDCAEVRDVAARLLQDGPMVIGFVEPPTPERRITLVDPLASPLAPAMERIGFCVNRYFGAEIVAARRDEQGLGLPVGTMVNPLIGGCFSPEKAAEAVALVEGAMRGIGRLHETVLESTLDETREIIDDRTLVPRAEYFADQLERDLTNLFGAAR